MNLKSGYKKIQLKRSLQLFWVLLMFFSCTNESISPTNTEDKEVSFALIIPRSSSPVSRAITAEKDIMMESIDVLVFEQGGKYLYRRRGALSTNSKSFTVNLRMTASAVKVHILANASSSIQDDLLRGKTESEVVAMLQSKDAGSLNSAATLSLPMHGSIAVEKINQVSSSLGTVYLLRSIARVDVVLSSSVLAKDFSLSGMSVYFSANKGMLVAKDLPADHIAIVPTLPTDYTTETKVNTLVNAAGDRSIENRLFIYENDDHTKTVGATKRNSRIVVGGYYNGSTTISYYPIDFKVTDVDGKKSLTPVLRNHKYILNILSVSGAGYTDEDEAAEAVSSNMDVEIVTWVDVSQDIIFDGSHFFYAQSKRITLPGNASMSGYLAVGSDVNPDKWEMRFGSTVPFSTDKTISDANFTVTKPAISEGGALKITTKNLVTSSVQSTLTIKVGRLVFNIEILQLPDTPADWEEGGDYEWSL